MTGFWVIIIAGAVLGLIRWFSTFDTFDDEESNDYDMED